MAFFFCPGQIVHRISTLFLLFNITERVNNKIIDAYKKKREMFLEIINLKLSLNFLCLHKHN